MLGSAVVQRVPCDALPIVFMSGRVGRNELGTPLFFNLEMLGLDESWNVPEVVCCDEGAAKLPMALQSILPDAAPAENCTADSRRVRVVDPLAMPPDCIVVAWKRFLG